MEKVKEILQYPIKAWHYGRDLVEKYPSAALALILALLAGWFV